MLKRKKKKRRRILFLVEMADVVFILADVVTGFALVLPLLPRGFSDGTRSFRVVGDVMEDDLPWPFMLPSLVYYGYFMKPLHAAPTIERGSDNGTRACYFLRRSIDRVHGVCGGGPVGKRYEECV